MQYQVRIKPTLHQISLLEKAIIHFRIQVEIAKNTIQLLETNPICNNAQIVELNNCIEMWQYQIFVNYEQIKCSKPSGCPSGKCGIR